ncbi:phage tail tape measure protein [Nocardioides panaciterrulae]|uniref:TP901 family phage tail tape measure protein n=1 Tax=Nocardioides panaciterrulae TaxID=661492 RepID=A0A7Y9JE56_9ACTN|nr:phage tail tape measure protein [Nocardioides panaciterrulae]NYD43929.1 TP901 family phage tail tape measure protein [Nocardioides panaciterrulae]NYD43998.1 TP901 family phage tail tape measure protein [Nocardioides panaciterrulae]
MAGPIRIAILANGRQARAEAALTARAYGTMGKGVSRASKALAGVFAIGALVKAGAAVTKTGGAYVTTLNKIQALTGSSSAEMKRAASTLENNAQLYAKMGQTTGDAASGVVELAKSGLTLNKSLKAINATMILAKAGELSVADASTFVSNTLNTFSLKASQAGHIANSLANAANISSADVSDLAESFKYAAPLAARAGVGMDQLNALLAELANQGIKGSQAGTGLRQMFIRLQAPTTAANITLQQMGVHIFDATGKMRPFRAIIGDLAQGIDKLKGQDKAYALKNLFGVNASTAASVILKDGVKTLDDYTQGVKKAGAAQKLANAQSKGFLGTLQSLKATGVSAIQSLYRQFSPKLNKPLSEAADWLAKNQDNMIAAGEAATSKLVPALKILASIAGSAATALKDTAVPLAEDLLPAVKTLADLAMSAATAVDALPQPIKTIGVQAAIAALILPRLTGAFTSATGAVTLNIARIQQWRAEMTYAETRAQNTTALMGRLGAAARTAAGVGGMVALIQGAHASNKAVGALETTLGGAATGFAVGGVVGAGLGGLAGLFVSIARNSRSAGDKARESYAKIAAIKPIEQAKSGLQSLKDTLDQVTGAYTGATRAAVLQKLQQSGLITTAAKYGISSRQVVNAALGQKSAMGQLGAVVGDYKRKIADLDAQQRAIATNPNNFDPAGGLTKSATEAETALEKQKKALQTNIAELKQMPGVLRGQAREVRATAAATADYTGKLKAIPKNVRAKIEAVGIIPTTRGVAKIAQQYNLLSKKKVRTLIQASGADTTVKAVQRVTRAADNARRSAASKLDMGPFLNSLNAGITKGLHQASSGSQGVRKNLESGPKNARADLSGFSGSLQSSAARAAGVAHSGGTQIGGAMKAGVIAGFSGTAAQLAAQAAAAVAGAIGAAKKAGAIRSPSRKMREVGQYLGDGLADGLARRKGKAKNAGQRLVHEVLKGVDKGLSGVKSALDKIDHLITSRLDGKKQAGRRKALLRSLKDEKAALLANGRAQDHNSKLLDKAVEKYKQLKHAADDFAKSIRTGYRDYGSVVGLGTVGGGTAVTLPALLSQLAARASVAQQFSAVIEKLKGKLNKTSLRQILNTAASGDLEGALATAQAIASGGSSAVKQINQLTSKISKAGGKLGSDMRTQFYGAGLRGAEGVVKGLEKRRHKLDQIADRLAGRLVNQVRRELHISVQKISPAQTHAGNRYSTIGHAPAAKQGDTHIHLEVKVPVGARGPEVGREIAHYLDDYFKAGGRTKVRWSK